MQDQIKKTLLVTLDFPPRLGGVATYYHNICKNLPPDKIVVLAPTQEGSEIFDRQQQFPIIRHHLLRQFPDQWPSKIGGVFRLAATVRWISLIRHINHLVKVHNIELIAAGQVLPIGTVAMMYQKRTEIPYIFFAHGMDITLPQQFMRKKTLLKNIIANAKGMIANSHFTLDELVKLGANPHRVVVAYPCPNVNHSDATIAAMEEMKSRYGLNGKKILLTVGRLVERKGHDMVIKALPKIIARVPNAHYVICGDGPNRQKLFDLVNQNGLGNHVTFTGALNQTDMTAVLHACDVFIMPSRQLPNGDVEGFGIVFLEANAFGKPVIGGKSGGVPEAITDGRTGLLVNPLDVGQISDAAIRLLTDSAYAERLGMQGLERTANFFDWKTQTEKIKSLLT